MTPISRRKFIQLTVLGGAAAASGLGEGCKNEAVYKAEVSGQYGGMKDRVYPYVDQPDGLEDGVPQYFATTCRMCAAGCGLFIRTMGGRAVKVEGNPEHPVNMGKTCARGQAALQRLYNPDRIRFPALRQAGGQARTTTDWETALSRAAAGLRAAHGRVAILTDGMTASHSPTFTRLLNEFARNVGARGYSYSLLDDSPWRAAAKAVYGVEQLPAYALDQSDCIVSFNGNFLEAWPSPVRDSRLFGLFRQGPRRRQGGHGRFIYIGPRMSMTAAKADQWLPCNPGTERAVALGMLQALGGRGLPPAEAAALSGLTAAQIEEAANLFKAAGARAVAVPGEGLIGQPDSTAAITAVESLNAHVKSACVGFGQAALPTRPAAASSFGQIKELAVTMQTGEVEALAIIGEPNPVFTLPAAIGFSQAMARTPFILALSSFEDETSSAADILLPTRTFLEEWGDNTPAVLPADMRLASLCQPVIDPKYITSVSASFGESAPTPWMDTRPTMDILIDLARRVGKPMADEDSLVAVRRTWARIGESNPKIEAIDNDRPWVGALSIGGHWTPASRTQATRSANPAAHNLGAPMALPPDTFVLQLFAHTYFTDGRHANLPWLQEIPDPMTSAVWNNWAEINLQTAEQLGIRTGDIVRITSDNGAIEVPALPSPGLHPNVIAMPMGQGHTAYGRYATGCGVNPFTILDPIAEAQTGSFAYSSTRVRLARVRAARPGYNSEDNTLVLLQDRPGGQEPEAVQGLIHETAAQWKAAHKPTAQPAGEESIFNRHINPQRQGQEE